MLLPCQDVPSLRAPKTPHRIDIVIEDFDVFRYYLHTPAATEPVVWTGDRVGDVIDGLGLTHLYDVRHELADALGESPRYRTRYDISDAPF